MPQLSRFLYRPLHHGLKNSIHFSWDIFQAPPVCTSIKHWCLAALLESRNTSLSLSRSSKITKPWNNLLHMKSDVQVTIGVVQINRGPNPDLNACFIWRCNYGLKLPSLGWTHVFSWVILDQLLWLNTRLLQLSREPHLGVHIWFALVSKV